MLKYITSKLSTFFCENVPATGIGLFRILFGLVTLQEIFFLLYFNHLIFDPVPYLDIEFPMIPFFLCVWAIVACFVMIGYHSQTAAIANYAFWIVFVNFTPMQRDFDGGFDLFMIGLNFFLIFMPLEKAFSIDQLRQKLSNPFKHYSQYPKERVTVLAYYLPCLICLGFLYFDSVIHKLFAEHWLNGLGAWLPASMPYYISNLDMTWLLNNVILEKTIGYTILFFQLTFPFLFHLKPLRPLFIIIGIGLHLGITLTLNIYPFGISMLAVYSLMIPFSWYKKLGQILNTTKPALTVFYDQQCPLCNRTVLIINHFDILKAIDFKGAQDHASKYEVLKPLSEKQLMQDLYAIDNHHQLFSGVDTYSMILIKMRYLAPVGFFLKLPGINLAAVKIYRKIADNRERIKCDSACLPSTRHEAPFSIYNKIFRGQNSPLAIKRKTYRLSKILLILFFFQLNSTIHYGLFYRSLKDWQPSPATELLSNLSNSFILLTHTFLGITPHALYLHDHFEGYNHIIGITYNDKSGQEKWLPLVNQEGRLQAPNWGRVHSMWANIAVTPNINNQRLTKFIMKVTAFWGIKTGLDLDDARFEIKLKKIEVPTTWVHNLLSNNLSKPWVTIGHATWNKKIFSIEIPDDINSL